MQLAPWSITTTDSNLDKLRRTTCSTSWSPITPTQYAKKTLLHFWQHFYLFCTPWFSLKVGSRYYLADSGVTRCEHHAAWCLPASVALGKLQLIALMMEAVQTAETSVNSYQSTRRYNPEDSHLCTHRHENLKSYIMALCFENLGNPW
jgi:hypothetical protein